MRKLKQILIGTFLTFMITTVLGGTVGEFLPRISGALTPSALAVNCDPLGPDFGTAAYDQECKDPAVNEDAAGGEEACEDGDFDCLVGKLPAVKAPQKSTDPKDLANEVAKLAAKSHGLFAPLINFFSFQIGNFLGNDYVFRGSMGLMLRQIWVISRNIVNIAFVFLLLWMALKEIFFVTQESQLKGGLIKFTLLLVAVNFSWLATKVVLDAANVVTHVVFAIPSGISGSPATTVAGSNAECQVNYGDAKHPITEGCYPSAIFAPVDSGNSPVAYWQSSSDQNKDTCTQVKDAYAKAYNSDGTLNNQLPDDDPAKKFQRRISVCVENLNLFKYDQNTAVIYLTYGMARIQNLVHAAEGSDLTQLAIGTLMSLIIQLAYTVALLALFLALIVRMAMLWFFVGFSPFMVLVIWFSGAEDREFGNFRFGFKEFANWAFVPARVGAVFAISFIMISAGQTATSNAALKLSTLIDNLDAYSGFVVRLYDVQTLFHGMDNLQFFIWTLMSLVVLWLGVFAVLSKMSIVGTMTERINEMGKSAATMVATAPYWAPVLPLGKGGERVSVRGELEGLTQKGPIADMMKAYRGKEAEEPATRKLQRIKIDTSMVADLQEMSRGGIQNRATAERIAKRMGMRNLEELYDVKKESVHERLRPHLGADTGKFVDDLFRFKPKPGETMTEAERRRKEEEGRIIGTAAGQAIDRKTGGGPAAPTPPTAPLPPASPAAPPGQAPTRNVPGAPGGGAPQAGP